MKRLAIFLTIVMMVAAMSGCMRSGQERTPEKPASVTVSEEPIKEPSGSQVGTAEVSGMAEATPEPSTGTTPPNGGDTTPTTTPEPEVDPSENLVISESTANSLMIHCLKQNGKVYNLSKGATLADSERNNYGFRVTMAATLRYIYYECEGIDGNSIGDISIGDITPPVFTPTVGTGALEFYAPSSISPMYTQAWKAEFVGYTVAVIDLRDDTSGGIIVPDFKSGTPEAITEKQLETLEIRDKNGNLVVDRFNLEYNEEYKVSWYKGTAYQERTMKACCRSYRIGEEVELEYMLGKYGFATISTVGLEPGLYKMGTGGYVEVK